MGNITRIGKREKGYFDRNEKIGGTLFGVWLL